MVSVRDSHLQIIHYKFYVLDIITFSCNFLPQNDQSYLLKFLYRWSDILCQTIHSYLMKSFVSNNNKNVNKIY
jgi:hypothetical protein